MPTLIANYPSVSLCISSIHFLMTGVDMLEIHIFCHYPLIVHLNLLRMDIKDLILCPLHYIEVVTRDRDKLIDVDKH